MFVILGVEAKFGVTIGKLEWLESRSLWLLSGLDGQNLGHFDAVVATDKNIASPRFTGLTGQSPPLGWLALCRFLNYIVYCSYIFEISAMVLISTSRKLTHHCLRV